MKDFKVVSVGEVNFRAQPALILFIRKTQMSNYISEIKDLNT